MSKLSLLENFSLHYPNMRIGRFALKAGEKIPLHIHLNQFGLAYLLKGKCIVSTYTIDEINNELFQLLLENKQTLTADNYAILTPKRNAHQIDVIEDSVFLDIFAPGNSTKEKLSDFLDIIESDQDGVRLVGRKASIKSVDLPDSLTANMVDYVEIT